MKCRIIQSENHNVFDNLAIEHAIIQNADRIMDDPTIRIWINNKSIIMGRGQDISKEVNQQFCIDHGIDIARRISGGGTVFQDLGNINLSFFLSPRMKKLMKIYDLPSISQQITKILYESLEAIGYKGLEIYQESNILYENKKISGSAGYLYKGWNLHHSTILTGVDLRLLNSSILVREMNPKDRKQSKYFETTNLPNFDEEKWLKALLVILSDRYKIEFYFDKLNQNEKVIAQQLLNDLYLQETWINKSKRKI